MTAISELVLVTGMTGAGRTTTANALEDLGFFVIDNLPPQMLSQTVELIGQSESRTKLAVVVDARSRQFFAALTGALEAVRDTGIRPEIVYLEASDDVLVRRQEAARRPHPLHPEGRLLVGFTRERELLRSLRGAADMVIDTSHLNTNQLGKQVWAAYGDSESRTLRATVVSFGYKYGIPVDADVVADMRFLPNPFWVETLRTQTGLDADVRSYVLEQPGATEFLDQYESLLSILTAGFLRENKRFLSVAIGCTGGKHRSVTMAEALGERLRRHDVNSLVVHRDLGRE